MKLQFPGQRPHEEALLILKKHWISDLKVLLSLFFFAIVPIIAYIIAAIKYFPGRIENNHLIVLFLFSFYLLTVILVTFISWLNHELDVIIVTNERVINHDQIAFLNRQVSAANLDQLQDVRGTEVGLIETIFHFGKIELRTAADVVIFSLHDAEQPFDNARKILDIRDKFLKKIKK